MGGIAFIRSSSRLNLLLNWLDGLSYWVGCSIGCSGDCAESDEFGDRLLFVCASNFWTMELVCAICFAVSCSNVCRCSMALLWLLIAVSILDRRWRIVLIDWLIVSSVLEMSDVVLRELVA